MSSTAGSRGGHWRRAGIPLLLGVLCLGQPARSGEPAVTSPDRALQGTNGYLSDTNPGSRLIPDGSGENVGIAGRNDEEPLFDSRSRLGPRDRQEFLVPPRPPYRVVLLGGVLCLLLLFSGYLWLRRRTAERHARALRELADSLKRSQEALRQSEERFRRAFEDGPIGVILASPDARVLRANRALCQMLGYAEDELLGLGVMDIVHPTDLNSLLNQAKRLFSGEIPRYQLELRFLNRARELLWGKITSSLLSTPEGKPQYALSIVEDITERKRVEDALRFTQIAIDHSSDAAFWVGPDARLIYVNNAACRSLGYSRDELLCLPIHEIDPSLPPTAWAAHWQEIQQRRSFTLESQHKTREGRLFPVEVRVNLIEFGGKEFNCAFARDISLRKQAEEALARSQRTLRDLIDAAPYGAHQFELRPDGDLVFIGANRAADRILGVNNEQFVGKTLEEAFPNLIATPIPDAYRAVARGGRPFETELLNYRDELVAGSYEATAVRTGPNQMAVFFRDITERKRAEDALRVSEERFSKVFHTSPVAISLATLREGRFIDVNESFLHLVGFGREELIGHTALELGIWTSPGEREAALQHLIREGSIRNIESHFRTRAGEIRQSLAAAELIELKGEACVLTLIHDITERKQAEEALRKSEERFQLIARATNDTVWDWDLLTNRVWWNEGIKTVFGYPTDEVAHDGAWWDLHIHTEDHDRILGGMHEVIKSGEQFWSAEYRYRRADGTYADVYDRAYVIRDPNGKPVRMIGAMMDITERKRVEKELAQARDQALESARLKSQFVANISHEVRTPLNGIVGMTVLLQDSELSPDQRDYLGTIQASSEALLGIINDILDFSKMEAGKLHFETLEFDLRSTVESTLELLADRAQSKHVELVSLINTDVPIRLRGDPGRLRQVITNILVNAIKFTERGEVVVRVIRESESDAHADLCFTVSDSGIGIPEDALPYLFQAFSQADGSTTRKYGGTGLGLAISKQLVEMMGGQIGVESTPGRGSTFWFTVRLEKPPSAQPAPEPYPPSFVGLRVLVADDNEPSRRLLIQHSATLGLRMETVATGHEALRVLQEAARVGPPFALAILDMQMPDVDGLALARTIKADPGISSTRLLMMTAKGPRNDTATLRAAGVGAFLVKPIRQKHLIDCLNSVLSEPSQHETRFWLDQKVTPGRTPLPSRPPTERPIHVLVAEDNPINQRVAVALLEKLGYQAQAVATGKEVLKALEKVAYEVILMDCQLPELDGFETTREIRRREQQNPSPDARRVHIIAMTAYALRGAREECLASGMDDYISKPVHIDALVEALQRAIHPAIASPAPQTATLEPSPSPAPIDPATLDMLRALREPDKPDPVKELIEMFLRDAPRHLDEMELTIVRYEATHLAACAHSFRGCCSAVGAWQMALLCGEIEDLAQSGGIQISTNALRRLREEFSRVATALQEAESA